MPQFLVRRSVSGQAVGKPWCLEVIVGAQTVASFDFNEKSDAVAEVNRLKTGVRVKQVASGASANH
jgi:hypothetical protein